MKNRYSVLSLTLFCLVNLSSSLGFSQENSRLSTHKDCQITYARHEFVTQLDQSIVQAITNLDMKKLSEIAEYPLRIREGDRTFYIKDADSFRSFFPNVFTRKWLQAFDNGAYFRCRGNEYQYGDGLIGILGQAENEIKPFKIVVLAVLGTQVKPVEPAPPSTPNPAAPQVKTPVEPASPLETVSPKAVPTTPATLRCETDRHIVLVDPLNESTYRYRSFGIEAGTVGKPQLELKNGKRVMEGTGACTSMSYTFLNVDTTYRIRHSPCSADRSTARYRLAIIRNHKVLDDWACKNL